MVEYTFQQLDWILQIGHACKLGFVTHGSRFFHTWASCSCSTHVSRFAFHAWHAFHMVTYHLRMMCNAWCGWRRDDDL